MTANNSNHEKGNNFFPMLLFYQRPQLCLIFHPHILILIYQLEVFYKNNFNT